MEGASSNNRPPSPTPTCVSMWSDVSNDHPILFAGGDSSTGQMEGASSKNRPPSPTPTYVSMKSDESIGEGIPFVGGDSSAGQMEGASSKNRPPSPTPTCVSVKSDESIGEGIPFVGGDSSTGQISAVDAVSRVEHVKKNHRRHMMMKYDRISEGFENGRTKICDVYTELHITEGEHGIQSKPQDRTGSKITCKDIFRCLSEDKHIRTVMSVGIAGTGKTFCVHKLILDWAKEEVNQDVDFVFVLPFRALNLLKDETFCLSNLLTVFHPELNNDLDSVMLGNAKIILTFDGLDESSLPLNFTGNMMIDDPLKTVSVDVLITSLIEGKLLPNAHVWITSRPEAICQIPERLINKFTEIQGFGDAEMKKYFMKKIKDQTQAENVITHVKRTESLDALCKVPLFCWILATVLCHYSTSDLPQSLTEFYIHFLLVITAHKGNQKHAEQKGTGVQNDREFILKLSELAYKELEKGNVLFYENSLKEYGIPVNEPMVYSWMRKSNLNTPVFCFMHVSIQEFLAALFAFFSSLNGNMECLKMFSTQRDDETTMMGPTPVKTRRKNDSVAMATFFKEVVDVSLQSKNGHLDLFLRFLLGISLESNQKLLQDILSYTKSSSDIIKETADHIKGILFHETGFPERCLNLLMCLLEMNDTTIYQDVQDYVDSGKHLLPIHCSALAHILLLSKDNLDEFDLSKYNTGYIGFKRLLVVLKVCKKARLRSCNLKKDSCVVIRSALKSENSHLVMLDLSTNPLKDCGLKELSSGLKHTNCRLKTLSLCDCKLRWRSCGHLALVLQSDTSHLKELDLANNNLKNSGAVELCAALKLQSCKLEVLRLSACCIQQRGCESIASALKSNHHSRLTELDLSYNYPGEIARQKFSELLGTQLKIIIDPEMCREKEKTIKPAQQMKKKSRQQKERENYGFQTPKWTVKSTLGEDSFRQSSIKDSQTTTSIKWTKHSERWQEQLQHLVDSDTVKRVGDLIFQEEILIAHGSQGTCIYLGLMENGTEVAIKRVCKSVYKKMGEEIAVPKLKNQYIVNYVGHTEDQEFIYIALQLCEWSLDEYLNNKKTDSQTLKQLAKEVILGLQVLHENRVIHRDIKPRNVLIDVRGQALLADFGLSRKLDRDQTTVSTDRSGTQYWEAAEILEFSSGDCMMEDLHVKYKKSCDIQVAGMLLYYILTMGKHHPFGKSPRDPRCLTNILDGKFSLEQITDEEAKDLIAWMIQRDPAKRPKVDVCLQHCYFGGAIRAPSDVVGVSLNKYPKRQSEVYTSVPQVAGESAPERAGEEFFSKHRLALVTRLTVLTSILIPLEQKRVLNSLEREEVMSKPTRTECNDELLMKIQRKGARAKQEFYEVLKEADPMLVEDLER